MDVQNTDTGLNLHITPQQERNIKNVYFDRVVPVTELIADRLLQFAESLPQDSKLFPELPPAHGKLSYNFGKTWRRYVRNKAGITDPKIVPMHSFRHYVIDLLYKAKVNLEVIKAMDGHTPGGGESGWTYAKGHLVQTLREDCLPVMESALEPVLSPLIQQISFPL